MTLREIADQATNTTSINTEALIETFERYFFEGEGRVFNPIMENRPKKPAKKLAALLAENGFDIIQCTLEQTEYKVRLVTAYAENFNYETFVIDYWNLNVHAE